MSEPETVEQTGREPAAGPGAGARLLIDLGPLIVFFVTNFFAPVPDTLKIFVATGAFMIAILIAMGASLYLYRRVSPMMWISAVLVVGFGGLTLWFHDQRFIQIKPTLIYTGFALLLFGGLAAGKPLLKYVFGPVFEGLSELGWKKISRNWAIFFAAMAVMNEVLRATVTFETWLTIKVWGVTFLAFAFGAANVPMLLRHGLTIADPEPPPTA